MEREDFYFISNGIKLYGTLWKPQQPNNSGLFFVTSSQGNYRSGTNAEAKSFASLGYTVFKYDKRGAGKFEGEWKSSTIEELCSDHMNALKFFSKKSFIPLTKIGIKGSSQGGIKIPYILAKLPALKFGISISCPSGTLLESDLNYWATTNSNHIGIDNIRLATKIQKDSYEFPDINYKFIRRSIRKSKSPNYKILTLKNT